MERVCKNCLYFKEGNRRGWQNKNNTDGFCYLNPPMAVTDSDSTKNWNHRFVDFVRPPVDESNFCSKWESKYINPIGR